MDKNNLLAGTVIGLVWVFGAALFIHTYRSHYRTPAPVAVTPELSAPEEAAPSAVPVTKRPTFIAPLTPNPEPKPATRPAADSKPQPKQNQKAAQAQPVAITEPVAREAMSLVGLDPAADEVWISAINDPSMTADQRSNLIEDLNEGGFADPRNVTADDLPVIEYRLWLIEQLAPNAMDDVNLAAFREAYKDLSNMYVAVAGR